MRFLLLITLYSVSTLVRGMAFTEQAAGADEARAGSKTALQQPPERIPATREGIRGWLFGGRPDEEHVVNPGETAYSIARRYGVLPSVLAAENPGFDPMAPLVVGQRLRIPRRAIESATSAEIDADFARYRAQEQLPQEDGPGTPDEAAATDYREEEGYGRPWYSRREGPVRVAMLLPFTVDGRAETSMADYYRGTLLGLEDLKEAGISVDLSVYDTHGSAAETENILWETDDPELIIGPRGDDSFEVAARFAARRGIPIVSPQSEVEGGNGAVFQARPAAEYPYEKLKPSLTGEYNVVLVVPETGTDEDFVARIEPWLPLGAQRVAYTKEEGAAAIRGALSRERENLVIVPTANENVTEAILATISSIQNNMTATTGRGFNVRVAGSVQWARFRNNDRELFFKLQAMYPTLYYADRTDRAVAAFERRYLAAFGMLPSLFSYRGYDVAKLFVTAVHDYGTNYGSAINRVNVPLLQAAYRFEPDAYGKWVNTEWVMVRYRSDYIIEVQ